MPPKPRSPKPVPPTRLALVDGLVSISRPTLDDYVRAASEYVLGARSITDGERKAGQIRLSNGLGRVLLADLGDRVKLGGDATAGERNVSGALRMVKADVSEIHPLDGLRLAIELKPVNLAVGRAIWNRFGDIRMTAVNLHLKFPFAVVGGVLAIPTFEETKTGKKSTTHLILRAIDRLERAGGRRTEGDAPHLLEGVAVVIYNPDAAALEAELPPMRSALRWERFIETLARAYLSRFGEGAVGEPVESEDVEQETLDLT